MVASLPQVRTPPPRLKVQLRTRMCSTGGAVGILHGVGALGAFAGDAVVGDGEDAAVDGDVAGTVDVDAVGAGGLLIVVGDAEVDVFYQDAVGAVEMAVPELGVFEGDAFDADIFGGLDEGKAGSREGGVGETFVLGATLPEGLPDGHAVAVEGANAGELEAVAVACVDEGRGEAGEEVAFDAGALGGEVGEVGGALEDGAFGEAEVDLWLEKEGSRDEGAAGDDDCASALGG